MMSDSKAGDEKNHFAIPEPYYLPGYTGHCPNYSAIVGQTYGRATHAVMETLPSPPGRLKRLPSESRDLREDKDLDVITNRRIEGRSLLVRDIAPGYRGHIPQASYQIGLNFNQSCIKGVAEFEKKKKIYDELLKTSEITNGG